MTYQMLLDEVPMPPAATDPFNPAVAAVICAAAAVTAFIVLRVRKARRGAEKKERDDG